MWFDDTGLPWIIPSPNMPTLDTATVYPGLVALEGTNLSEGRGTTKPFEFFGAPWIDGFDLAKTLNGLGLPGVRFREAWFTPSFSKFQGELCGGCQVHVTDRAAFRPFATALHIIKTVRDTYPGKFEFHVGYFDQGHGDGLRPQGPRGGNGCGDDPGQHPAWPGRLRRPPQALFALLRIRRDLVFATPDCRVRLLRRPGPSSFLPRLFGRIDALPLRGR